MWARERNPCVLHSDVRRPCGSEREISVIYIVNGGDHVDLSERSMRST